MVKFRVGGFNEHTIHADDLFKDVYRGEWLADTFVKQIILDIDKSIPSTCGSISSPVLGEISPEDLSTGAKTLILMHYYPEIEYDGTACGDNCGPWILKIGNINDIQITLDRPIHFRELGDKSKGLNVLCVNNNKICDTMVEYIITFYNVRRMVVGC